jgi:multiple sugar transport system substrate-binding protein
MAQDKAWLELSRRRLLGYTAAAGAAALAPVGAFGRENPLGVDFDRWTPDYIKSIAGTIEVDTAAECAKIVPLDYKGHVSFWYVGPTQASPRIEHEMYDAFFAAFKKTYPNITIETVNLGYNDIINKLRVAALGKSAPMVGRLMLLWGVELAAKGQLMELKPEDVGHQSNEFWPGAVKTTRWGGKTYGVPTNNETMALIWNAQLFADAGLNPELPPQTWAELVEYSKQIRGRTGKAGYGLVARVNAGNTPYRFMPKLWAYGGGALDEADPDPTYKQITINSDGSKAALQVAYDMYVRDRSVPVSALTNTQTENQDPFIAGQLAMVISHPSEYAVMLDRAAKATGEDKKIADGVIANMRYGLFPKGPVRRGVVFGGWNAHMFKPDVVGGKFDEGAAKALVAFMTGPEWSVKLAWAGSNPGNLRGFRTTWMKQRLEQIRFLDVTTSMLPYGIAFPPIPESTEIMNIVVPEMMQNALTQKMTVSAAADDAAAKIKALLQAI